MTAPATHITNAQKLTPEGEGELFEITFPAGGTLYLKKGATVTWQGQEYTGAGIVIEGEGKKGTGERVRPTLKFNNPYAAFSKAVSDGLVDNSIVVRKKVLKSNLEGDNNIFESHTWYIARCSYLDDEAAVFELRNLSDRQRIAFPPRQFIPPEFTYVSL